MAFLTREQILASQDLDREVIALPEWGGDAHIRVMTGAERDYLESVMTAPVDGPGGRMRNIRAVIAALTLCDEHGGRLFSLEEVDALGAKSSTVLDRIFLVARRLNKLTTEDVEQLEKNVPAVQNGVSGSSLPVP